MTEEEEQQQTNAHTNTNTHTNTDSTNNTASPMLKASSSSILTSSLHSPAATLTPAVPMDAVSAAPVCEQVTVLSESKETAEQDDQHPPNIDAINPTAALSPSTLTNPTQQPAATINSVPVDSVHAAPVSEMDQIDSNEAAFPTTQDSTNTPTQPAPCCPIHGQVSRSPHPAYVCLHSGCLVTPTGRVIYRARRLLGKAAPRG